MDGNTFSGYRSSSLHVGPARVEFFASCICVYIWSIALVCVCVYIYIYTHTYAVDRTCSMNAGVKKTSLKFSPKRNEEGKNHTGDPALHRIILKRILKKQGVKMLPQLTGLGVP